MKLKAVRYVSLFLLVFWMGAIFFLSAQPATDSNETSEGLIEEIVSAVYPSYDTLSSAEKAVIINRFSFPVRKAAHFSEFALLGLLAFLFFWTFNGMRNKYKVILPLVSGFVYAVGDEIHQGFVPGRACRALDVLIDFAGVLTAVLLAFLIALKFRSDKVE